MMRMMIMMMMLQLLGKKDILATLHPGPPPAESSSLGTQQRKTLGVLSSLAGRQQQLTESGLLGPGETDWECQVVIF